MLNCEIPGSNGSALGALRLALAVPDDNLDNAPHSYVLSQGRTMHKPSFAMRLIQNSAV
jgi:hypothetical protein